MLDFLKFQRAVAKQFERMDNLYVTEVEDLWETYLESFPEGTNPMYRTRSDHDCSCCRSFIKRIGHVVDSNRRTLWDIADEVDPAYKIVADVLAAKVRAAPIVNIFLTPETTAGSAKNFENIVNDVKAWDHFFLRVPDKCVNKYPGPKLSDARATHDVMLRSLTELTSIETVQELISQNSLYRGEENKFAVDSFSKLQREFRAAPDKELFVWAHVPTTPHSVARIRNTAIGTLLVNLSEGMEIEDAVKAFESVVAPANYKRPTALVTKAQVETAKATIEALGLTSALQRRYAVLSDITINNIIFADRSVRKTDIFDEVDVKTKSFNKVEEVPIGKFLTDVLPKAKSLEVFVENRHASNLVSLIAPEDPTAGKLFKWDNHFSWSYNGQMADAIKERVKAAGGSVIGDLCCRLAWEYADDLDFHCIEPNGYRIHFSNKRVKSPSGGLLDLDANGGDGQRTDPAENIYYPHKRSMEDGIYTLLVNNYSRRSDGRGFIVEIEFDGVTHRVECDKVLKTNESIQVAKIRLKNGGFEIIESLPSTQTSKEIWGLKTNTFQPVNVVMLSPNHWERSVGNKHYFFMIANCKNPDGRGFFNEFLDERLTPHRKVLEMVGGKMKVTGQEQLSGLGFSFKNDVVCKVKGSFDRCIKVLF